MIQMSHKQTGRPFDTHPYNPKPQTALPSL